MKRDAFRLAGDLICVLYRNVSEPRKTVRSPELGESFDGVDLRKIGRTFDLQIAQLHQKVTESLIRPFFI
jgi:hypothetical protein